MEKDNQKKQEQGRKINIKKKNIFLTEFIKSQATNLLINSMYFVFFSKVFKNKTSIF
jgi:hypothetical protein